MGMVAVKKQAYVETGLFAGWPAPWNSPKQMVNETDGFCECRIALH